MNEIIRKFEPDIKTVDGGVVIAADSFFSLFDTLECGQCFRFYEKDSGFEGVAKGKSLYLEQRAEGLFIKNVTETEAKNIWAPYFGLDTDYERIYREIVKNERLRESADSAKGVRILKQDFFETLISFIISQNNFIPRIKGIVFRLCENFGERLCDGNFAFPTPEAIYGLNTEDLAPLRCGFRDKYILSAATEVVEGRVTEEALNSLDFESAKRLLMTVKGVGPKVAECVLLYGCARLEAFPVDVWIRRVMAEIMPEGLPAELKPVAGIAQQYLFHHARNLSKKS